MRSGTPLRRMAYRLHNTVFLMVMLFSCYAAAASTMKVLVAPVVSAPLVEKLPLSGTLTSPKFSDLATRINGYVEKLYVDVGDRVGQGDPLLSLDAKIAKLQLERLTAARQEAEILHRDAERLAAEAKELADNKHISQTEYESRLATAAANRAEVSQLSAEQAIQQEQLERHTLRAPFAGIIAEKLTEAGEWVNDDSAVLRLAQMHPLYLEVRVPERYFGRLREGSKVTLNPGSESVLNLLVDRVVPVSDPNTRTFLIRAVVPNSSWVLLPGMSVKAEFTLADKQAGPVLQVPADAVVRRTDGSTLVWAVRSAEQGDVAQPVEVIVGRSSDNRIEVTSDRLKPGDPVVILGNESLRPGQPVTMESSS